MSEPFSNFSASCYFVDRGRVAIALNRQLLEKPTANDALLLTTILSTELGLLKKRGFNGEPCIQGNVLRSRYAVERILKRHTAQNITKVESGPRPSKEEQRITGNIGARDPAASTVVRTPGTRPSGQNASSESTTSVAKFPEMTSPPPSSRANNARLGEH
jgi:hypothetical protein